MVRRFPRAYLAAIFCLLSTRSYAIDLRPAPITAVPPKSEAIKTLPSLTLKDALDRVFTENYEAQTLKLDLEDAQIAYRNAWDVFYLPNVNLSLNSTSSRTLGEIGGTPAKQSPSLNRGYPSTTLSLGVANYTLFNFWRDRIIYDTARLTYERAQQRYTEIERSLRFRTTNAYFQTKANQDRLEIATRSYEVADSILKLLQSRKRLGLANDQEIASSTADLTNAKITVDQSRATLESSYTSLTSFLNYPPTSRFNLTTPLPFDPMNVDAEWAVQVFKTQAPGVRDQRLNISNAEAALEVAQKARLPLPVISISGLSVSYTNGAGPGTTTYGSSTPGGQVELQTSISLTIPLVGSGGFLNSRAIRQSILQRERTQMALNRALQDGEITIRNSVVNIHNTELQIKNLDSNLRNVSTVLDSLISNIQGNKKVSRLELRDAIEQARSTELSRIDAILSHLTQKLAFLETIGTDEFPDLKME